MVDSQLGRDAACAHSPPHEYVPGTRGLIERALQAFVSLARVSVLGGLARALGIHSLDHGGHLGPHSHQRRRLGASLARALRLAASLSKRCRHLSLTRTSVGSRPRASAWASLARSWLALGASLAPASTFRGFTHTSVETRSLLERALQALQPHTSVVSRPCASARASLARSWRALGASLAPASALRGSTHA